MRNFYEIKAGEESPGGGGEDARVRRFLQLATLAFWGPCSIVDLFLLWRGGTGTGGFVFGLLFRQALVFLALWFAVAASHGLMRGERRALDAPTKRQLRLFRRRTASDGKSFTAPSRGNRGQ